MIKLSITTFLFTLLFSMNTLSGQVISTEINVILDNSPTKEEYNMDMNGDGQDDFTLQFLNGNSGSSVYKAHVGSYNNNEVVCPNYLNMTVYNNGNIIGPATSGWYNSTGDYDPWDFFYESRLAYKFWMDGNNSQNGNFLNLSNKFIGVRFFVGGNTHYGYIEVSCIADPQPGYLEIHKMAYEATPNTQITAGAEGCDTDTYYLDNDDDGFGDVNNSIDACDQPAGYVLDNTDCDDDNNMIYPNAQELCNDIDDNCNGLIDDNAELPWYQDADNDGFGNPDVFIIACDQPTGYILDDNDCDDTNEFINPDEFEQCNGIDENCNGIIDEDFPVTTWYADNDDDGFGDLNNSIDYCEQPIGFVLDNTDCDDTNDQIYPGAFESCNGIDDNCDGQIDEEVLSDWYLDSDGDGFGNPDSLWQSCDAPAGYVEDNTDCNDEDANVNGNVMEICNGIDDNCDGMIDEGYTPTTWYFDMDGDGYGDNEITELACDTPMGYVAEGNDCNDDNTAINPSIEDICNGIDDNCDGQIDENTPIQQWFEDRDEDGFGDNGVSIEDCIQPDGYVLNNLDCDDDNENINPDAQESCNGIDDNCDGQIDEDVEDMVYYFDGDGDGFGIEEMTKDTCAQPVNYVLVAGDCNDANFSVNPDAKEICNNIDDNCDGTIDETTLTIEIFGQDESSSGSSDGIAWVTVLGGDMPYSFSWSNMSTDSLINNLEVGDYSVTVSDASNCDQIEFVSIGSGGCDTIEVEFIVSDVLCFGDCNGAFVIETVTGGQGEYTFLWWDNITGPSREDLCPGSYSLLVIDALDCQTEIQFDIQEPNQLEVELNPDSTYVYFGGTPPVVDVEYWVDEPYFYIEIEDSNGCAARDSLLKTATKENDFLNEIKITPTITSSHIYFDFPSQLANEELIISTIDLNGQTIRTFTKRNSIFVGDLSDGTYFLKFDSNKGSHSIPIIVVH